MFIKGSRVLMRVDFNVPIKDGKVKDSTRIEAALPTIQKILDSNPKNLILVSHLGRPDGRRIEAYSLRPVALELERLLGKSVMFLDDCVGEEIKKTCDSVTNGAVILLENLRFHPEEEKSGIDANGKKIKVSPENVRIFCDSLTSLGDIYINDAFGTAHRAHSSITGINLPIKVAGYLMQKELDYFSRALETPTPPLLVILGGAKVKDKIQLIYKMLDIVDEMIIGGGMAFTFLKRLYQMEIGNSLFDEEGYKIVDDIMEKADKKKVTIHLPVDFICSEKPIAGSKTKICDIKTGITKGWMGLDIGPETIAQNKNIISRAKTIIWNGPQGLFEIEDYKNGSVEMLECLIKATESGVISIVGGGDTVALVQSVPDAEKKLSHVSTGGGASLELLEGRILPGLVYLSNKTDILNELQNLHL